MSAPAVLSGCFGAGLTVSEGSTAALVGEFVDDPSVIRSGHQNWDGIGVRSARSGRSLFQGDRVKADVQIHLSRVNALATPVENHWRAAA